VHRDAPSGREQAMFRLVHMRHGADIVRTGKKSRPGDGERVELLTRDGDAPAGNICLSVILCKTHGQSTKGSPA